MVQELERERFPPRASVEETQRPVGWTRVTQDRKAIKSAGVYYGSFLLSNGSGAATVTVYDGHDVNGDPIDYLATSGATTRDDTRKTRGIRLLHGLYVDLGSNVNSMVVFFDPPEAARQ